MSLDAGKLATALLAAIRGSLKNDWPTVKDYAKGEAKKLAASLVQIEALRASGQITEAEASVLFEMQKNATRAVLLAIKGMGIIAVENAINAALGVIKDTVNTALGFALIV